MAVLVAYCCIKNGHTFRSLKQHTFLIPIFCVSVALCPGSPKAVVKVLVRLTGEESASDLSQVVWRGPGVLLTVTLRFERAPIAPCQVGFLDRLLTPSGCQPLSSWLKQRLI